MALTKKAQYRKIVSAAERELEKKERARGHLDVVTELGIALGREVPKGDSFLEWVEDEEGQRECVAALLSRGFSWEEIQGDIYNLTRWPWLPPIEMLQQGFAAAAEDAA